MFLNLFSIEYGLVSQLERMKRYGILGRYLPEFGKIIGQMQHDLFHRYTVDSHTLLVIKNLRRFRLPHEQKSFPIAAHIIHRLDKPELLYIAGLYHDIGKGRGGDHSTLGAIDAENFCRKHNLSNQATRLVCWLVEKHLLMSYVSQKQDISDPEVVRNFAMEVGDRRHLDYLYALTVADMCGTNPDIWNSWRASLMRQLYQETKRVLRRGLENTIDKAEIIAETQQNAMFKLENKGILRTHVDEIWQNMGDEYFVRENARDIVWQTEAIAREKSADPIVIVHENTSKQFSGATQIFIRTKDAQHIFTAVATCLAGLKLNIQDARIYNSANGYTLDTFYVLDEHDKPLICDLTLREKIVSALKQELSLLGEYSQIISQRTPRQLKQFDTPTQTSISNDIISGYTVLEVISPDRPGLLATIARTFMDGGIQVQNAKISTLGERIEDIFYITDCEGNPLGCANQCIALQKDICEQLDKRIQNEHANI